MRTKRAKWGLLLAGLCGAALLWRSPAPVAAQPSGPTFTPSPTGPQILAFQDDPVNLRSGPGTEYDQVGVLVKGQIAPILGVTQIGPYTWFKIVYIGGPDNAAWVYKDVVRLLGDIPSIPTILPPPTPTLRSAGTPAGAATESTATPNPGAPRLPTFTAPAPVVRPTLLPVQGVREAGGIPPAMIILSLFVLGVLGGLASLLRRR